MKRLLVMALLISAPVFAEGEKPDGKKFEERSK